MRCPHCNDTGFLKIAFGWRQCRGCGYRYCLLKSPIISLGQAGQLGQIKRRNEGLFAWTIEQVIAAHKKGWPIGPIIGQVLSRLPRGHQAQQSLKALTSRLAFPKVTLSKETREMVARQQAGQAEREARGQAALEAALGSRPPRGRSAFRGSRYDT